MPEGISLKMACGSKMALFLFADALIFLKLQERNNLYKKQNDLKGQKWKLERAMK